MFQGTIIVPDRCRKKRGRLGLASIQQIDQDDDRLLSSPPHAHPLAIRTTHTPGYDSAQSRLAVGQIEARYKVVYSHHHFRHLYFISQEQNHQLCLNNSTAGALSVPIPSKETLRSLTTHLNPSTTMTLRVSRFLSFLASLFILIPSLPPRTLTDE